MDACSLDPSPRETASKDTVIEAIIESIRGDRTIKLPDFDPDRSVRSDVAFQTIGIEPNPFGGQVGEYRYQFEGEEDLLHLIVSRLDFGSLSAQEGQSVCAWLLPWVPPALFWFKSGAVTQHFYVGHDELIRPFDRSK